MFNPFPKQTHHPKIIQSILTSHSHRRLSYPIASASASPTPQSSIVLSQSYSTTGAHHHHRTTPLVLVSIATRASPLGHSQSHSGIATQGQVRATRASPLRVRSEPLGHRHSGQGQSHSGIATQGRVRATRASPLRAGSEPLGHHHSGSGQSHSGITTQGQVRAARASPHSVSPASSEAIAINSTLGGSSEVERHSRLSSEVDLHPWCAIAIDSRCTSSEVVAIGALVFRNIIRGQRYRYSGPKHHQRPTP
jgi:hypothetical protein